MDSSSITSHVTVRTDQLDGLRRTVALVDRHTRAHGLGGCRITHRPAEPRPWPDVDGVPVGTVPCQDVTVTLPLPCSRGWTVVARLERHRDADTTVTALTSDAAEAAGRTIRCDTCGASPATGYLLQRDDGTTLQLDEACAEPYTQLPGRVLRQLWQLIGRCADAEPYAAGTAPPGLRLDLAHVLEPAVALTLQAGYAKRGGGTWTTADQVRALLLGGADAAAVDRLRGHLRAAGDVEDLAAAVREWCRRGAGDTSEFRRKLARAAGQDTVSPQEIGLLVSAVPLYLREAQRQLVKSDRESITATVTEVGPLASNWGQRRRIRFTDGAGRRYVWESMTRPFPEEGQRLRVTGHVVRNAIRNGIVETHLTRCRVTPA